MSPALQNSPLTCPRCQHAVDGQRFDSGAGHTWLWRCICGWSRVVAESGVVNRGAISELIAEREGSEEKE